VLKSRKISFKIVTFKKHIESLKVLDIARMKVYPGIACLFGICLDLRILIGKD
jgi:hypothetical protein